MGPLQAYLQQPTISVTLHIMMTVILPVTVTETMVVIATVFGDGDSNSDGSVREGDGNDDDGSRDCVTHKFCEVR